MVRIALATDDGVTISGSHFAHAKKFLIYDFDIETNRLFKVEERVNPLGEVSEGEGGAEAQERLAELNIPMHGIAKYRWLRENVLGDVDAIIAGGACQMSYSYFTSVGVQMFFVNPGTSIMDILSAIEASAEEG